MIHSIYSLIYLGIQDDLAQDALKIQNLEAALAKANDNLSFYRAQFSNRREVMQGCYKETGRVQEKLIASKTEADDLRSTLAKTTSNLSFYRTQFAGCKQMLRTESQRREELQKQLKMSEDRVHRLKWMTEVVSQRSVFYIFDLIYLPKNLFKNYN